MTKYVTSYMKKSFTYDLLSYLLGYVGLWGFTCPLHLKVGDGIIGKCFVCYVTWSLEYEKLILHYDNVSLLTIMLYVDGIRNLYMFYGMCIEDVHMT